ncbi:hypothetical protein [uncultured Nitrosomonas sp.]|uniref:hypothetical protein n=1 Tax=uncultured Nitrosomonas sp. TaxID=156424 RepID=UPI0025E14682|nr:hypothetical protein [uncultured Nitrosomonas sp.]
MIQNIITSSSAPENDSNLAKFFGNESFRYKQSAANAKIRIQQREKEIYFPEENLVDFKPVSTSASSL